MKNLEYPWALRHKRQVQLWDEFWHYTTAYDDFTTNATAIGGETVAVSATLLGGQLVLTTGGTTSNEAGIYSTVKGFKQVAATATAMLFETCLQYVDANSHDCGFFFGFSDVLNANGASGPLTAAAAAFRSSFTGFGFGKFKTDTSWRVISSVTTTQQANQVANVCDDAASSLQHTFTIEVIQISATVCEAIFKIDGAQCRDYTTGALIKHTVTFGATAMYAGLLAKAGSANSQVPAFDYIEACQVQRQTIV